MERGVRVVLEDAAAAEPAARDERRVVARREADEAAAPRVQRHTARREDRRCAQCGRRHGTRAVAAARDAVAAVPRCAGRRARSTARAPQLAATRSVLRSRVHRRGYRRAAAMPLAAQTVAARLPTTHGEHVGEAGWPRDVGRTRCVVDRRHELARGASGARGCARASDPVRLPHRRTGPSGARVAGRAAREQAPPGDGTAPHGCRRRRPRGSRRDDRSAREVAEAARARHQRRRGRCPDSRRWRTLRRSKSSR